MCPCETLTSLENVDYWGKHLVIASCEYVPDRENVASWERVPYREEGCLAGKLHIWGEWGFLVVCVY